MNLSMRECVLLGLVGLTVAGAPVAWSARQLQQARSTLDACIQAHRSMLVQCAEVAALRDARRTVESGPALQGDVHARTQVVLQGVGLDPRQLKSTTDSAPSAIQDTPYQRQVATVIIEPVSAVDAARVVTEWRDSEPGWTIRSVRLDHAAATGRGERADPTRERFTLTLTLDSVHLATPTKGTSAP
jgi:hypothetical protein